LDNVRNDLRISPSQAIKLDAIRNALRAEARKIVASAGSSAATLRNAEASLQKAATTANARALALLTPAQKSRLTQIEHQLLGGTLLASPSVQKQLALSTSQITSIEKIRAGEATYTNKVNADFHEGLISHQDRIELLRARRLADADRMMSVLTPEQRKAKLSFAGQPLKSI
jgi:Spy/CpxP family protein refolding chaperone